MGEGEAKVESWCVVLLFGGIYMEEDRNVEVGVSVGV